MADETVSVPEGSSVFDVLKALGLTVGGDGTYVRSINGLSEKACGARSGWIYKVDGDVPKKSCGDYVLAGGEEIVWLYTCDYVADGYVG